MLCFIQKLLQPEAIYQLKNQILKFIFEIFPNDQETNRQTFYFSFLYDLLNKSFFKFTEIIQSFLSFRANNDSAFHNYLYLFYIYFSPELFDYDQSLYDEIENEFKTFSRSVSCATVLRDYSLKLDSLKSNNWELFKSSREIKFYSDSIEKFIINDQVDELQALITDRVIDINSRIQQSPFSSYPLLQNHPTLIQFSSFFGSVKCFKYLFLENADLKVLDDNDTSVIQFAIAGGNLEIIHILENNNYNFSGSLQFATRYHNFDLFDWLYTSKNQSLTETTWGYGNVLTQSIQSFNYNIFDFCINKIEDINLLHVSCKYNNEYTTKILLKNDKIDINSNDIICFIHLMVFLFGFLTPLQIAAAYNSFDVMPLLINDQRIDINAKDFRFIFTVEWFLLFFNRTALHYAAKHGSFEAAKILISEGKCDLLLLDLIYFVFLAFVWLILEISNSFCCTIRSLENFGFVT